MHLLARTWPDAFDTTVTITYLAAIICLPLVGYVFLVVDVRAYMRRLRGALVVAVNYFGELPGWATEWTPPCVAYFDLALPCDEEDLMRAYREVVKSLHPDRGGDLRKFLRLQKNFEQAIQFLRTREAIARGGAATAE